MKSEIGLRRLYSAQLLLHSSVAMALTCPRARSGILDMLPGGSADSSRLGCQARYFENRHLSCADRLSEFELVHRKTDPLDRRSVLVQRTAIGAGFLRDLKRILTDAAKKPAANRLQTRRSVALGG